MNAGDRRHESALVARLREAAWRQVDAAVTITDLDGRIVDWNDGATRLFGWTPEEAIDGTWEDLAGPAEADPDPRRALIRQDLATTGAHTGEVTVAIKSGERIPILVSCGRVRDEDGTVMGSVGIAIDDRRRSHAEERFEVAFREAPVASAITTGERQLILDVNPAFEQLSGLARRDVVGRTSNELELWDDPAVAAEILLLTRSQMPISDLPVSFRTRNRATIQARLSGRPIQLTDGPAYLWMAVDETDRVRAEAQLQQAQRLESIGLLAGGIAHDFNNIMTAIRGSATLAVRQLGPGHEVAGDLERIVEATERAVGLTAQLLAFSGRQVVRPERLDLAALVRQMTASLVLLAPPGVAVVIHAGDAGASVQADAGQLRQVLVILARNAIDAMPLGGSLRVSVTIEDTGPPDPERPRRVRLTVADSGTGMTDAVQARIFEPFFTTKAPGEGTGLGLAVVHGVIERCGGTIAVVSTPEDGTTFTIELPAASGADPAEGPADAEPPTEDRPATILLVEDEAAIRQLARRILERRGHTIIEAEDGQAGLEALGSLATVDLVLTDLTMPRMGGVEMAARIAETRPDVPVIFMSGHGESALARDGVLDPGIRLLSKPFAIDDLVAIVHDALAGRT